MRVDDGQEAVGADELLSKLLGDAPDLAELEHRLLEASEGSPLFLEESGGGIETSI
jgi:hypothetical protein